MKRRRLWWLLLVALVVPVALLAWLLATESGLRFIWGQLAPRLPAEIGVEQVAGRLSGPLQLSGLHYAAAGTAVSVAKVEFDWRPSALLSGRLQLDRLAVSGVDLTLPASSDEPPPEQPAGPLSLPEIAPPLPVVVEGIEVTAVTIRPAAGEPVVLEQARLAARLDAATGLTLTELAAAGPWGQLQLTGHSGLTAAAPLALNLSGEARLPQLPAPLTLTAQLAGSVGVPELAAQLSGAVGAQIDAQAAWIGAAVNWSAKVVLEPTTLADFDPQLPPLSVAGRLSAEGAGEQAQAQADLSLHDPASGDWRVALQAKRQAAPLQLEELQVAAAEGASRLSASGSWDGAAQQLALSSQWQALRWPLSGEPQASSESGQLEAQGGIDALAITAQAGWQVSGLPAGTLDLSAQASQHGVQIDRLGLGWLAGEWVTNGQIDWAGSPSFQLQLALDGVDPGEIDPRWQGTVAARLAAQGELGETPRIAATIEQLEGRLLDAPLSGQGQLQLVGENLTISQLRLASGDAQLEADGELAEQWGVNWRLALPRLGQFVPEASGSIKGSGRIEGPRQTPHLLAQLGSERLRMGGQGVEQLTLDADVDTSATGLWQLAAKADGVQLPDQGRFDQLTLTAQGSSAAHTIKLAGSGPERELALVADGGLSGGEWHGTLHDGRIVWPAAGSWQQGAAAELQAGGEAFALTPFCLKEGEAQLCLAAAGGASRWQGEIDLSQLPLSRLLPERPDLKTAGSLALKGQVAMAGERLEQLNLEGAVSGGALSWQTEGGEKIETGFDTFTLTAHQQGADLLGALHLALSAGGRLDSDLRIQQWQQGPIGNRPLSGTLAVNFAQLDWVAPLVPGDMEPHGRLQGELHLGGEVAMPEVSGQLAIADGAVVVPAAGIAVTGVELAVASAEDKSLGVSGRAQLGMGELRLDGRVVVPQPERPDHWQVDLKAAGQQLLVAHLPEARVVASPDLTLAVTPEQVEVTGKIEIPEADIGLPNSQSSVGVSEDVVVVDRQQPTEAAKAQRLLAKLTLIFGDAVRLSGAGFSGRLTGTLTVEQLPGEVPRGRGELSVVDGVYEAYGQKLSLDRGRLLFSGGPVDNPALDLRAVRTIEEDGVVAGVEVSGRAQKPEIRLFSEPPMEEANILSYVMLGRPLYGASKSEAMGLQQAAAALGMAGGSRVAKQIGEQFGLDQVEVDAGAGSGQAAVVLGKYLSPRLYVQYLVGMAEAAATWRLRYQWTKHWVLQAETGSTNSGGDILFTIER